MQPLDKYVFGNFKNALYRISEDLQEDCLDEFGVCKPVILQAMWAALRETFTDKKHVIASFRDCGIWPFNIPRIRSLVDMNSAPIRVPPAHLLEVDTAVKKTLDANKTPASTRRKRKISNVKRNQIYHSMDLAAEYERTQAEGMYYVLFAIDRRSQLARIPPLPSRGPCCPAGRKTVGRGSSQK